MAERNFKQKEKSTIQESDVYTFRKYNIYNLDYIL